MMTDDIDILPMTPNETPAEPPAQPTPPRRRRKKRYPKWAKQPWQKWLWRHWPPIRFGLICIALLILVIWLISTVVGAVSGFISGIADNTADPSGDSTGTSTSETTTPPETTMTPEQHSEAAAALLEKAELMAAGYDYLGAIELLQNSEYFSQYPEWQSYIDRYTQLDSQLVSYPDMQNITHIFFHSLIVDTDRAFDGDYTADGYNLYMATVDEFNAILQSMYDRGYVLVTPYQIAYEVTDESGTHFTYGDIRLPEGKIPFVMSQDDLNYYGYMIGDADPKYVRPAVANAEGDGFAHKVVIGEDGYPTCEYIDADGNVLTGDYDLVPLLERFIQEHPDFAYHGARAVLGMTGYEGVFGYRTKPAYEEQLGSEAYAAEVEAAREVAQCLRDHGWILASHSYGHPRYGDLSAAEVEADSDKWEKTVESIIGEVDVILYPNGSDIAGIGKYTFDNAKFAALYKDGFRYFYNVDSHYAWQQLGENYFRGGRRNIDGYRMYHQPSKLDDLFDVDAIFDDARPTPVPKI